MYPTMRFADFAEVNPKIELTKGEEYPFVEMAIVAPGHRYVSTETKRVYKSGGARFEAGDILFARITPCLEHGKIAQYAGRDGEVGFGSTEFLVFRHRDGISDPSYVFYLASSDIVRKPAEKSMSGASGRQRADLNTVKDLEIYAPPLPTQRKIAAVLSAYDDHIENNTRRIAILEEMAQLLYREWFVHFRFPGHEQVTMVDSELGPIPEGWEVRKLSKLVETQYGYTESAREEEVGPKFVRGKDINKAPYIQWDSVPYCPISLDKYVKYRLNVGDIVVIRMADPGKVGIIEKDIDAIFASYLIRFHIKSTLLLPYHLFYFLSSDRYQNYATGASTGTTRKSASAGVLTDIDMIIPTGDIREQFEGQISALRQMLNNLLDKNANLRRTRNLLLPRLISGEVDVSELKINVGGLDDD